jgi:adenylate kinase
VKAELAAGAKRLSDAALVNAFRWRLQANHCRNRGYILDGWPKTYDQAVKLFTPVKPVAEEGEEDAPPVLEDEDEEVETVDRAIFPHSVILLSGDERDLNERVKNLPQELLTGTHYTPADMARRYAEYATHNLDLRSSSTVDFF